MPPGPVLVPTKRGRRLQGCLSTRLRWPSGERRIRGPGLHAIESLPAGGPASGREGCGCSGGRWPGLFRVGCALSSWNTETTTSAATSRAQEPRPARSAALLENVAEGVQGGVQSVYPECPLRCRGSPDVKAFSTRMVVLKAGRDVEAGSRGGPAGWTAGEPGCGRLPGSASAGGGGPVGTAAARMAEYYFRWVDAEGVRCPVVASTRRRYGSLFLLAAGGGEQGWERARNAAAAGTLLLASVAVHDDIIDEEPVRNGRPTVHAVFGVPAALYVGNALVGLASELLAEEPSQLAGSWADGSPRWCGRSRTVRFWTYGSGARRR